MEPIKAIPIASSIQEETLLEFQKKNHLPLGSIQWELMGQPRTSLGLTFPVLLRNQKIAPASVVSTLSIPRGSNSWVYVDPQFEDLFIQTLTP